MLSTARSGRVTGEVRRRARITTSRAEQLRMDPLDPPEVAEAERLTDEAKCADADRAAEMTELYQAILHTFAKLTAVERTQRDANAARAAAEEAWRRVGLSPFEAQRRVGVQRDIPFEVVGHNSHRWLKPILTHLRAARNDFSTWWRL